MPKKEGEGQDPTQAFQNLLTQKNNDAMALATQLFDENYRYRETIREMKTNAPKEGDIVLTGDDAKEYQAFKALNVKADDVKKAIDAVPDLEKKNKELSGMEQLRELADIGIDGSKMKLSVLKDQLASKFPDAVITFKTEKDKDGKESKIAQIQKTDKDAVMSFTDFANAELADYLPSLKVSNEANEPIIQGNTPDPKPQGGAASVFDRIRESVKKDGEANKANPADLESRFGKAA